MNHIYRSLWNSRTGIFTAVSENTRTSGKQVSAGASVMTEAGFALKALAGSLLLAFGTSSYALPVDGVVVAGSASVASGNGSMTINQSSQNVVLNWQSFNIGAAETVNFVQPNSNSVALNRVIGADPSSILGSLSANGKVFLVNPNGILFGKGASVNVGGLVASTLNISDNDFMAGKYTFAGAGGGSILNQGSINADGGYVALLGANVSNEGLIVARLGSVALVAGNGITLDVVGDGLLNVAVDQGAVHALVSNGGMIQADGGQVLLSAQAAGNLLQTVVNNTGVIQAQTIENHDGVIKLLGDMQSGTVNVGGKLDASAPTGGNGGFIETSAAHVKVTDNARITTAAPQGLTGSWLIDPTDYTIAASGGNITGAALSANLGSTDIIIQSISDGSGTAGNVNVNDAVSWSAHKLTLNAQNNININANLNASATASLALEFGQSAAAAGNTSKVTTNNGASVNLPAGTTNFTTKQGSDSVVKAYTVITSLGAAGSTTGTDLQGMNGNTALNYALGANIDATATSGWNAGAGFVPIGTDPSRFAGIFDGLGHTVSGLFINRTGSNFTGLFGYTAAGSMVRNVGLIGGSVASNMWGTGSLVGALGGTLINSYATGSVYGFQTVGGLVGVIDGGAIVDSHATGNVVGGPNGEAGGLVGLSWGPGGGTVNNSYATGNVSSAVGNVGGLMGINWGTVTGSFATGTVNGTDYIGGLIGNNSNGSVASSYATGAVNGNNRVGGLAGNNSNSITNSYATGAVTGIDDVGGLAGSNNSTITNSYATGIVNGHNFVGGLIGQSVTGNVTNSYSANSQVAGTDSVGGLVGYNNTATINDSYSSSAVSGQSRVGGLFGTTNGGVINSRNYASGNIIGTNSVGGLVGQNGFAFYIFDSYATGNVTGVERVGGLVGYNGNNGSIANSYSIGAVSGTTSVGGLVGSNIHTVSNSFWDTQTSGLATSAGGIGMTTAQMHTQANFNSATVTNDNVNPGWDFSNTWIGYDGHTSPLLRSFMTALAVTANSATKTYDGLGTTGGNGVTYSTTPNGNLLGTVSYSSGINVGSSTITPGGLYSNQQGYIISYVDGALTVNKADLTLGTSNVSKIYDGSLTAAGTATVASGTLFGSDALSGGTFAFADKNAGIGTKTVTTTGVTVTDGNSGGNYNVTYTDNTSSTITPKSLTVVGATAQNKVYDGTTLATLVGGTLAGLISGDSVTLIEAGTFATREPGNGIAVAAAVTLAGTSAGNYSVTQPTGLTANITAPVTPAVGNMPDLDTRNQGAITSAVSTTFSMPLQAGMAGEKMLLNRKSSDLTISTTGDEPVSILSSIVSIPGELTGLNLLIKGDGLKLPSGEQSSNEREDKN